MLYEVITNLVVGVVVDPTAEPRVRQEAVRALEQIGFNADLADALGLLHHLGAGRAAVRNNFV